MLRYIARRLLQVIPLLLVISLLSFGLYQLQPGDPVKGFIDPSMINDPAAIERVRHQLGLDQHWTVQYAKWMGKVIKGDLGNSLLTGEKVTERLGRAVPRTLKLTMVAFALGFLAAIAIGVVSATRRYTFLDHFFTIFSFAGISVPNFWLGILLILLFSVKLKLLPSGGMYTVGQQGDFLNGLKHMVMPVICLAMAEIAGTSRYVRSSLLEVMRLDYIRTARAKGLAERIVVYKHGLRNALIPIVTLLGLNIANLISGSIVLERLFAWPGMGRVAVEAVFQKDYPVIMGANILFSLLTVIGSIIADLMYAVVDPRVKFS